MNLVSTPVISRLHHHHMFFIIIVLIILMAYAIGIVSLVSGVKLFRYGWRARYWPMVQARLEECEMDRVPLSTGSRYEVLVTYSYSVAGVTYSSDKVARGYLPSKHWSHHEKIRRRVLDVQPFMIRHHPTKPHISVILPTSHLLVLGTFAWSLVWLLAANSAAPVTMVVRGIGYMIFD